MGARRISGPLLALVIAVVVANGALIALELSFSGRYMGKEAGFALFEPANLVAVFALFVSALVFVISVPMLLWKAFRRLKRPG